ncbi:SPOP [Lepeophtheirus salmonis]|uniref:SPOP n=1 Tax=Lepeophtheirus salmonis TaxID=72036 RepID=A0A7R8D274_LEPSM|nr:SPOP [Lepeophtheirus salmonis]CAF3002170.1 SPOP [Lepeophtheirus salmonis]
MIEFEVSHECIFALRGNKRQSSEAGKPIDPLYIMYFETHQVQGYANYLEMNLRKGSEEERRQLSFFYVFQLSREQIAADYNLRISRDCNNTVDSLAIFEVRFIAQSSLGRLSIGICWVGIEPLLIYENQGIQKNNTFINKNFKMTSGSVNIKNFSWNLKSKKRHRSGSGGSKDNEAAKKKSFLARKNVSSRRLGSGGGSSTSSSTSNLEMISPSTADIEFKYTWSIDGFLKSVKIGGKTSSSIGDSDRHDTRSPTSGDSSLDKGLDSKPFEINVNGVQSTWNLGIRFLVRNSMDVGIKYKFGVLNRTNNEFEMDSPTKTDINIDNSESLKSVGYKNMLITEKHMNANGDIQLVCKMNIIKEDNSLHSLSSDLKNLINDEKSSDIVIETAEGKKFKVHRNILSARSPVFADMLKDCDKSDKLELKDFPSETFEELLRYIYTDSSANVDLFANTLLAASDKYQLPGLKTHCEKHLVEIISPKNVASFLLLADKYKCEDLKKSALTYCKDNVWYIMKDEQWKVIEEEKPDLFEEAVSKVVKDSCFFSYRVFEKERKTL